MLGLMPARWMRRAVPLWALAVLAVVAFGQGAAVAKSSHHPQKSSRPAKSSHPRASYYVIKSAKAKCKAHYTKQTVTLKVRRHHRSVRVHQIRCVYTGNGAGAGGGGIPVFPVNLPTAGVTVTAIPTAAADTYNTAANQVLSVGSGAGVLANDSGLGLSAGLVSGAAHGTVTLDRNGAFHYTPMSGYSGIDHFSYHASDSSGESSGAAQVTIHVTPLGATPGVYSVASATTLSIGAPGLLAGAVGSGLHAALALDATHGSVTVHADGSFSYAGDGGFAGLDSFQFVVVDAAGQASGPVTVTVSVGASPPALVDQTFSGAVGNTELQAGGTRGGGPEVYQGSASALAGDSDPNGGTLSTPQTQISTAHGGTVSLASDGSFTYQPPVGFNGPSDSFSYTVLTSEGASAQAGATIDFNGSRVWYVNQSAPAGGNGGSAAPFNSLASVSSPGGTAGSGDVVFLFAGSYGGGIALAANETLVGAPAGLTVGSVNLLAPSGTNPVITNASSASAGVSLAGGDDVSAVTVSATAGAGISVVNANTFTIAASVAVTNAGADGIDVTGGGGNATVAATVSGSAAHAVDVQTRSSGTLTFSGALADSGDGLMLSANPGATVDFTGAITASTTNSHPAFEAIGGGTVAATSGENTLSSTAAAALDVDSTAIGSGGLDFQSISSGASPSSGPADGVILSDTGSGPLNVSGTQNIAGSGGTIQGTSVAAMSFFNTGPVTLNGVLIEPAGGDGVLASVVPALEIFFSTFTGANTAIAASGDASTQAHPQTFDIEQDHLSGQHDAAIALTYAGATTGYLLQNHIGSEIPMLAGSTNGDGIDITPSLGGSITGQIAGNEIDQIDQGNGIDAQAPAGAVLDLTVANNTVEMDGSSSHDGIVVGPGSAGTVCLNPTGNIVSAAGSSAGANGFEVDQLTLDSVFQIQGYAGDGLSDVAAYLVAGNPLLSSAHGSAAVATPDGSNGFTGTPGASTCPTPPPNSGDI
jgi:hypothetical protein